MPEVVISKVVCISLEVKSKNFQRRFLRKLCLLRRRSLSNSYRHNKWTCLPVFKSWTRLFAFHIVLIPLGKVWIQLFSFHLWVNNRATNLGERIIWIQTSCRPGEWWVPLSYFCSRHATWITLLPRPNQFTGPVKDGYLPWKIGAMNFSYNFWLAPQNLLSTLILLICSCFRWRQENIIMKSLNLVQHYCHNRSRR